MYAKIKLRQIGLNYVQKWKRKVLSLLVLTSLESLGQDETFKSLESLVRLFQKVSKIII